MPFGIDDAMMIAGGAQLVSGVLGADAAKSAADTQAASGRAAIAEQARQYDTTRADLAPYRDLGTAAVGTLRSELGLGGSVDENDPRYQQLVQSLTSEADKSHKDKFGISIFNTNSGLSAPGQRAKFEEQIKKQATQQFISQFGDQSSKAPGFGSLTKPFTFDPATDPGYNFRLGEGTKAIENSAAAKGSQLSGATLKELLRYGQDFASGEFNAAFNRDASTKGQLFGMLSGAAGMGSGATNVGVQAGTATAAGIGNTITGIGNANAAGTIGASNALSGGLTGAGGTVMNGMLLRNILNQNQSTAPIMGGVNLGTAGSGELNAALV